MRKNITKKSGFTLIELLVVIAIIAILAAILFPVFARARENARRSTCISNLKQISLGIMQYSQDYDENYPVHRTSTSPNSGFVASGMTTTATTWIRSIMPYIKSIQIFVCPSATPSTTSGQIPTDVNANSYFASGVIIRRTSENQPTFTGTPFPLSLAAVDEAANVIMLQEFTTVVNGALQRPYATSTTNYQYFNYTGQGSNRTHFDGGNIAFADGHVKWRKFSSICLSEYGVVVTGVAPNLEVCGDIPSATSRAARF